MMTRLVSWLFFIGLALAGLLLVLPGMIDWSRHKDLLVSELSGRLGQDMRIDGDVSLRLLPNPHLSLEKVSIGSAEKNRYLVSLQSLEARMSMDQLLHGKFVIDQIHLREPVINISIDDKGSNWRDFWSVRAQKAQAGAADRMIALKQVSVSRASVVYHNHVTGQQWSIPRINMSLTADSLYGPYQARGDMTYGDAPLTFTLATQPRNAQGGLPFTIDASPIEDLPEVKLSGVFSPLEDVPLSMSVDAREGKPADLFAPFDDVAALLADIAPLSESAQAVFKLELVKDGLALKDIKISAKSGSTLAGDVFYDTQRAVMNADVTLTRPGLYWLGYDGALDLVRKQRSGKASWKIENIGKIVQHAPEISLEAAGDFSYAGKESWTLANAKIILPEWQGVAFDGQVQRVNGQTVFALITPQMGMLSDLALNGQLSQTLTADGKATVMGQSIPLSLSGAPEKPDIAVMLKDTHAQDILSAIGATAKGVTLEGGNAEFKGQVDLQAPALGRMLAGTLSLSPQTVKIAQFAPAGLQKKVLSLETVPDDLAAQLLAAVSSEEGRFTAKPLVFTLPVQDGAWQMKGLTYDGGSFDFGTAGGESSVSVTASDETKVSYKGKLPLGEKAMPVERASALILERHPPAPQVDTKAAIGDILDRLDDGAAEAVATEPAPAQDMLVKPPQEETAPEMPPQPQAALPVIEVAPPPALPEDTPLAVEIPPSPDVVSETPNETAPDVTDMVPDEIFPLEEQ